MQIHSPVTGWVLDISSVPDEVFSSQMLGAGLAVVVTEAHVNIASPVSGTVIKAMPHAMVVSDGTDAILVHIGIDTVSNQEYFTPWVTQGDEVIVGQILTECNLQHIIEADEACPVIMTVLDSPADSLDILAAAETTVQQGTLLAHYWA